MPRRLITKSDFARLTGCRPSTVTRAATKALAAAMVADRVDAGHAVALAWADRQKRRKGR